MVVLWAIGAALSVVGSICSNLGVNIQKYSFMLNEKKPLHEQKKYCKQPQWLLGLAMVTFGSIGDFAALALAAQSIVAPIGSITLVANLIFAHYWLKEKLGKRDIFGTSLIVAGSTIAVAFGDHTEVSYTLEDLKYYYTRAGFVAYGFIVGSCIIGLYLFIKKVQPIKVALNGAIKAYEEAVLKGDESLGLFQDEAIAALEKRYEPYEKFHPFSYCALSGIFGGQSILFGKMVAELARRSFAGDNQMIYGLTYVFLILMLATIFSQLHFLAIALSFFDALYVVPVFQCFFISVSTLGGASYFYEFSRFNALQWVCFPLGLLMTLCGVYLLSARSMKRSISHAAKMRSLAGVAASDEDQVIELAENGEPPLPRVVEDDEEYNDRSAAATPTNANQYSRVNPSELIMDTSSPSSLRNPGSTPTATERQLATIASANSRRPRPPTGRVSDKVIQDEAAAAAASVSALAESPYLVNSESGEALLASHPGGDKGKPNGHPVLSELTFTDHSNGTGGPMTPTLPGMAPRSPNPAGAGFPRAKRPRPPSAPRAGGSTSAPGTPNPPTTTLTTPIHRRTLPPRTPPVVAVGATSILTIAPPFALAITAVLPSKPRTNPPSPVHATPSNRPFLFQLPERLPPWSSFNVANFATTTAVENDEKIHVSKDKIAVPILAGHGLTIRSDEEQPGGDAHGHPTPMHAVPTAGGETKETPPRTPIGSPPGSSSGRMLQSRYARRRLTKTNLFANEEETVPLAAAAAAGAPTTTGGAPAATTTANQTPSHHSASMTPGGNHFFPSSQHSSTHSLPGINKDGDHHVHHASGLAHHSHVAPAASGTPPTSAAVPSSSPVVAAISINTTGAASTEPHQLRPPVPASPTSSSSTPTPNAPLSPTPAPSQLHISIMNNPNPQGTLSNLMNDLDETPAHSAHKHYMPHAQSSAVSQLSHHLPREDSDAV